MARRDQPALRGRRWAAGTAVRAAAIAANAPRIAARDRRRDADGADLTLRQPVGRTRAVVADDGTVLNVRVTGRSRGPTFVLTHGLCCDHRVWRPIADRLATRGRVVVWDLRGHGRTPAGTLELTPRTHARDLARVVEATTAGPVVLVGHSLGGMTSLRYLIDLPEGHGVVASVLLATPTADLATSTLSGRGTGRLEAAAVRRLIRAVVGHEGLDARFMSGATEEARDRGYGLVRASGFGRDPRASHVTLVHEMITQTPLEVRRACLDGMTQTDLRAELAAVDVPTLVVIGARDRLVNPQQTRHLARALPRGHALTFRHAGHALVLERASHIAAKTAHLTDQVLDRGVDVDLAAVAAG